MLNWFLLCLLVVFNGFITDITSDNHFGLSAWYVGRTNLSLTWREKENNTRYIVKYRPAHARWMMFREKRVVGNVLTLNGLMQGTMYDIVLQEENKTRGSHEVTIEVTTESAYRAPTSYPLLTKVNTNKDVKSRILTEHPYARSFTLGLVDRGKPHQPQKKFIKNDTSTMTKPTIAVTSGPSMTSKFEKNVTFSKTNKTTTKENNGTTPNSKTSIFISKSLSNITISNTNPVTTTNKPSFNITTLISRHNTISKPKILTTKKTNVETTLEITILKPIFSVSKNKNMTFYTTTASTKLTSKATTARNKDMTLNMTTKSIRTTLKSTPSNTTSNSTTNATILKQKKTSKNIITSNLKSTLVTTLQINNSSTKKKNIITTSKSFPVNSLKMSSTSLKNKTHIHNNVTSRKPLSKTATLTATTAILTTITVIPSTSTPSKKLRVTVTSIGTHNIFLRWVRRSENDTYTLRYKPFHVIDYTEVKTPYNRMNLIGLEAGTTYTIKVLSSDGISTIEGEVQVSTDVPVFLFAPTISGITNISRNSARISWYSAPHTTLYNFAYRSANSSNFVARRVGKPTILLTNLNIWSSYFVKVQVSSTALRGQGPWSREIEFKTKPAAPTSPLDLYVCGESSNRNNSANVLICWSPPKEMDSHYNDAIFYRITWCTNQHSCVRKKMVPKDATGKQMYVIAGVPIFSKVAITVTAVSSDNAIGGNVSLNYKTKSLPAPPSTLKYRFLQPNSLLVSWKSILRANGYFIAYKSRHQSDFVQMVAPIPLFQLSYLNTTTSYRIKVKANFTGYGSGEWSEELKVRTAQDPPSKPRNLRVLSEQINGKNNSVTLHVIWNRSIETEDEPDYRTTYSINWCVHATHKLRIYGCYNVEKVLTIANQTFALNHVMFNSTVLLEVTSFSEDGVRGEGSSLKYIVTSQPPPGKRGISEKEDKNDRQNTRVRKNKLVASIEQTVVKVTDITQHSAHLSWLPVANVTSYKVTYTQVNMTKSFIRFSNSPSILLSKLEAKTKYNVVIKESRRRASRGKKIQFKTSIGKLSAPRNLTICSEEYNQTEIKLCWYQPLELDFSPDEKGVSYSINWCILSTQRLFIFGCYKENYAHRVLSTNQSFTIKQIPYQTSLRITVTSSSPGDVMGGSAEIEHLVVGPSKDSKSIKTPNIPNHRGFANETFPYDTTEEVETSSSRSGSERVTSFSTWIKFLCLVLLFQIFIF